MNWQLPENRRLIESILALKNEKEAESFLRDLMTENEIKEFSKRLKAAEMLSLNIPYSIIEEKTGLSSTTVARVSKWLNSGEGGYKKIIERVHHHDPV
ncbi:MAG: YerC/YecD family TrpR-related protein [Candidatus Falkowbacteria bacterium]|nr:YerC/YecD family TrpR-related protein [Candidatus Falkowbacteria bacterium]